MQNKNLKLLFILLTCFALLFGLSVPSMASAPAKMQVHFIDVGQGDSELIQSPGGKTLLIDGGKREAGPAVINFLKSHGVKKIDIIISTHPHEDHIGSLREVLRQFPVGLIIDPMTNYKSSVYRAYLKIAQTKGIKISPAKSGTAYDLGKGSKLQIIYCNPNAEDPNNTSVVAKVSYGKISTLFMGDLEAQEECNINTQATVLKVGHHGSRTSTTLQLLGTVKPKEAIISCGKGNEYGHPHDITLQKLLTRGIKVYRTDKAGNITLTTDGKTYTINAKPNGFTPLIKGGKVITKKNTPTTETGQYIGNKNSHKFHKATCNKLPSPANRIYFKTRDEAIAAGYKPCKICDP